MNENKRVYEQLDELGIDRDLISSIGGVLDNLKVLFKVIDEHLEEILREIDRLKIPECVKTLVKDTQQLMFIIYDEYKLAEQATISFTEQINKTSQ